jgi:hypothetical protein
MLFSSALLLAATSASLTSAQATYTRSSKRGLIFIPSADHPSDNQIWVENGSDLTWYYNYGADPSATYNNRTQDEFEFVPMLWSNGTTFLSDIKAQIKGGRNISHVGSLKSSRCGHWASEPVLRRLPGVQEGSHG